MYGALRRPRRVQRHNIGCNSHGLEHSFSPQDAGRDGAARHPCQHGSRRTTGAILILMGLTLFSISTGARAADPDIRRDATVVAIDQVLPSVVNIATETVREYHEWYDTMLREFYGWPRTPMHQVKSVSLGSGVIIDPDGYVLTNLHVVRRANRIQVKLWDGREYDAEPLVGTPGSDVALLKLKTKPGEKFKAIKLAPDGDLLLGETVLALGNPYGLGGSVTRGILSSKKNAASLRNVAEVLTNKKKGDSVRLSLVLPRRLGAFVQLQQGAVDLEVR